MLKGYWLFGEANTRMARDPALLNEYISLFKHACLFQREVNLSDLMVIAAPNFREAFRRDADFRHLVESDWVNIWYMHPKRPADGEGTMDLVGVKDFHHQESLYSQEEFNFFSEAGNDEYLRDLQRKKNPSTLKEADGALRDPIFTQRVMDTLDCTYLRRLLGDCQPLFAQITRELQAKLAATGIPLGAIHFEAGRNEDGTYRWGSPTTIDRLYDCFGNSLPAERRTQIAATIWRYYRTHLVAAEMDLTDTDPLVPPENAFYVEVGHGEPADKLMEHGGNRDLKVYPLSTELDDALLYRHLDFKTIERIRNDNAGVEFFKITALPTPPPGMTEEASEREQSRLATDFGEALVEYRRRTERVLSERFAECCRPGLNRTLLLTIGTSLAKLAVDGDGKPRPVVTTTVKMSLSGAVAAVAPQFHPCVPFLTYYLSPWLRGADSCASRVVEKLAGQFRRAAFAEADEDSRLEADVFARRKIRDRGAFTLYRSPDTPG